MLQFLISLPIFTLIQMKILHFPFSNYQVPISKYQVSIWSFVWWYISATTCQIIMSFCQFFMSSCQIFMLTCQIFILSCHMSLIYFLEHNSLKMCSCPINAIQIKKIYQTSRHNIWKANIIVWKDDFW